MNKFAILILLFSLNARAAMAQKFTAGVDRTSIGVGDIIRLTYTASGSNISGFIPPDFPGFRILSGPEIMPQIQIINGNMSSNTIITYALQAVKKGKIIIPPAHFRFSQKVIASNTILINVSRGGPAGGSGNTERESGDIFMLTHVNKTQVVLGEAIEVSYKMYFSKNVGINSQTLTKLPTTGFWVEDANDRKRPEITEEKYKGRTYRVAIVRRLILFPQKTGELTVEPLEVECNGEINTPVQQSPDLMFPDMFDQIFNSNTIPFHKTIKSNPVKIVVDSLPESDKPASFTGMVGRAVIAASADKSSGKANEPINFTVTLGGEGNLTLQQAPKLNLGADIEVYDPKITDKIDRSGANLSGTRTFEYTLMPHKAGRFTIPPIPFSYFDPVKKTYSESKTVPIALTIEKNDKPSGSMENTGTGTSSKADLPDYIKWIILFGVAVILLIAVRWFVRKKVKLPEMVLPADEATEDIDFGYYLNEAARFVETDPDNDFYTLILNALYGCAEQISSLSFSDINHESIRKALMQKNIPEDLINNYLTLIQTCEMIKYAPSRAPHDKAEILASAKGLIGELGKY